MRRCEVRGARREVSDAGRAWQDDLGVKVTRAIKEILRLYQLNVPESQPVEQALHVVKTGA